MAKKNTKSKPSRNNPVAKYAHLFNKAVVHRNRKKAYVREKRHGEE